MKAHFVLAHPEPQSFNASMVERGVSALRALNWSVTVTDLYRMSFDPCERKEHFFAPSNPSRFDVQSEQRHAAKTGFLPSEISEEISRLDEADLVVLQYPMWWHMPPAMLKGWFDRVFAYGEVYSSSMRFEEGRFRNKRAMLSVTVGTSAETYDYNGRSGDIDLLLWPVNFTLSYVGFTVLEHFVAYGVEAGLRYSDPMIIQERMERLLADYEEALKRINERRSIPFNKKSEWTQEGRIRENAPSYSPFIRQKKNLIIE